MEKQTTIVIDLDVFKALHAHINYINEPLNDVLRRLLGLNSKSTEKSETTPTNTKMFTGIKGVLFPIGMKLTGKYLGNTYEAVIVRSGLQIGTRHFGSPSGAANSFCNGATDGWKFWHFTDRDGREKPIKILQTKKEYLKQF
ncbi:MAG: hypothetical protein V4615_16215 [Bacteroidota bacterium]